MFFRYSVSKQSDDAGQEEEEANVYRNTMIKQSDDTGLDDI